MTDQSRTMSAPRASGLGSVVFLVIAVAGGIYGGTRWHASIAPLLGIKTDDVRTNDSSSKTGAARELWTCGMHPQVIQDHPGDCPICHMKLTPLAVDAVGAPAGNVAGDASPMGIDLVPVYEEGAAGSPGTVVIDPAVVQNMGVRTTLVSEGTLHRSVRLVGYLDEAEPNIHEVNLRVSGWIKHLHANTEGMHVELGDPLFDLYSPELQISIEELISARRSKGAMPNEADESMRATANTLYDAALRKLELIGLERTQIQALAKLDKAPETITFTSPVTGDVTERMVVEGASVKIGDRVLRIVDRSTLWVDARVFEKDLPFVTVGQKATVTIASRPGEAIEGEILFIHPIIDAMTRSALARIAIPNPSLMLHAGMYATVRLAAQLADRAVLVPREAVIDTGESQMAFVAEAVGRFQPRRVRLGLPADGGMVQVVEGLAPGEAVVTSGQFLLDSESRLREAIQKFLYAKQVADSGGSGPTTPAAVSSAEISTPRVERMDAVVAAYLAISDALGAEQTKDTPLDMSSFIVAADALRGEVLGTSFELLALDVAKAAAAMKGHPLEHQREAFKALSTKVIALVEILPPSTGVGSELFVMHCPMAPGTWIQTTSELANPYYATEMKRCGQLVKRIATKEGDKP